MSTKKRLITEPIGNLYKLKWAGGGELPQELCGLYTSEYVAQMHAQRYLVKRNGVVSSAKDKPREE